MSKNIRHITQETIATITTSLAQVSPLFNELIPSFTTRYAEKLAKCLECTHKKMEPLKEISTLYYMINKERPFPSGNKRIALAILLHYLAHEDKWLNATPEQLFGFAHWVSMAPADAQDEVIAYIEKFINKHMVNENMKKGNKEN